MKPHWLLEKEEIFSLKKQKEPGDILEDMIKEAITGAMENLLSMRNREGEELKEEISLELEGIEGIREKMSSRTPQAVKDYQKRLSLRLEELLQGRGDLHQDRLPFEVAAMAERSDITEELVRIKSHVQQLKGLLTLQGQPQGKKMDFIAQELNREVNTIGSKATDLGIINGAIQMKGHIHRIREQAKNIE